jgi:lipopolysaccharide/colanic/teichoic acid biosynthesis glycosyltransferase
MAQISGRSDLEFEDEVRLDTWYIENWSLWKDLYIVLKTPFAVLYRKGAY